MRALLDRVYDAAAYLAAFFMVGTLAMVLLAIIGRLFNWFIPGTDAYAGYCMAACGFLALAHTLKRGEHIRVSLLLEHAGPGARRALELWSLGVASILAGAFAWYGTRLALQSWQFNDISTGNDARRCGFRSWRWPPGRSCCSSRSSTSSLPSGAARGACRRRRRRCTMNEGSAWMR